MRLQLNKPCHLLPDTPCLIRLNCNCQHSILTKGFHNSIIAVVGLLLTPLRHNRFRLSIRVRCTPLPTFKCPTLNQCKCNSFLSSRTHTHRHSSNLWCSRAAWKRGLAALRCRGQQSHLAVWALCCGAGLTAGPQVALHTGHRYSQRQFACCTAASKLAFLSSLLPEYQHIRPKCYMRHVL